MGWAGVAAAVVLCLGVGIALQVASENLPYRQQEGLETVIALVAVAMVSYMVVWMRRHARSLKHELEGAAGAALDSGSGWALVAMAFLAVLREGFETAVFLVAAFNESAEPTTAATGALIGILVACVLGYGIYSGWLPHQPRPLLPHHRRRAGAGGGRAGDVGVPQRPRSRLDRRRPAAGRRPHLAGASGFGAVVVAHRHARLAARARR